MLTKDQVLEQIKIAISRAAEGKKSAEMHLQMIKYAEVLGEMSGREFCERVGLEKSFATEFSK